MATQPGRKQRETIDFAGIAERADLPAMMAAEGIFIRNGKSFCPFHENDRTEALSVFRLGDRWQFKCHGCGAKGDAIDWRAMRYSMTKVEAARALDGQACGPLVQSNASPLMARRREHVYEWTNPEWQAVVTETVRSAERELWAPKDSSRRALAWLRSRGLEDFTIKRFNLGFFPSEGYTRPYRRLDGQEKGIRYDRGVSIPWSGIGESCGEHWQPDVSAGGPRWVGVNVRRLMSDPFTPLPDEEEKNRCFAGSQRGFLWPEPEILPSEGGRPFVCCEGEMDAMIAWQEVGHLACVGTVGGAKQSPHESALVAIALCPWVLLALDSDEAGIEGAQLWGDLMGDKARRLLLPGVKDIGDLHQSEGAVEGWLRGELARLGIELATPSRPVGPDAWRWHVANWPMPRWLAWRRRSAELQPASPTAAQIREADHAAYLESMASG